MLTKEEVLAIPCPTYLDIPDIVKYSIPASRDTWHAALSAVAERMGGGEEPVTERILCAAIWYQDGIERQQQPVETGWVACGHRHCNIHTQPREERLTPSVQGFLTSKGQFASRRVALRIARAAGQLEGRKKHPPLDELLSEDLY